MSSRLSRAAGARRTVRQVAKVISAHTISVAEEVTVCFTPVITLNTSALTIVEIVPAVKRSMMAMITMPAMNRAMPMQFAMDWTCLHVMNGMSAL